MVLRGRLGSTRLAILTINPEEFDAVQGMFDLRVQISGTPYYVKDASESHTYDLIARYATGRGNAAAAEMVRRFVEHFYPEVFLLVGTAGGVRAQGINLGDVVVADYVEYSEFRKIVDGSNLQRKIPYDHPSLSLRENFAQPLIRSDRWKQRITCRWPDFEPRQPASRPIAWEGNILSSEEIWGDVKNEEQQRLLNEYDKVIALEMEAFGVARAVCDSRHSVGYNPRYLVIRGISDLVDVENSNTTRHQWTAWAAEAAASFAYCLMQDFIAAAPSPLLGQSADSFIPRAWRFRIVKWFRRQIQNRSMKKRDETHVHIGEVSRSAGERAEGSPRS